jgi:ATP-binding cassette, subfamily B, bacterial
VIRSRSLNPNELPRRLSVWRRLRPLLGGRRRSVVALAAVSVLSGLTEAGVLAVIAQVAASLVDGATHVTVNFGPFRIHTAVGSLLVPALILALIRLTLQVPISLLPARMAADAYSRLCKGIFDAFTRASWALQSRDREGHLQELMTNQIARASEGVLHATNLVTALFTFTVLIVSALVLNLVGAVVVLAAALLLFFALRPLNRLGHRRAQALSQAQMEFASGAGEAVRVAEEVQVFGVAAAQRARIDDLADRVREPFFRTQLLGRLIPNLYQSMLFLIIVAGLAGLYASGSGHAASLGAVVLLLVRAGTYGQQIQGSYQLVSQALPYVARLQDAEQRYLASGPVAHGRTLATVRTLALENVSYGYRKGRPVVSDISFAVARGEVIGIIGPSGAGKSTLVQILLQLRMPDQGGYLVNGLAVEQFARDDWHRRVAYVPQEPRLVHASVADNIRFFRSLEIDAVHRAGKLARIHDEVIGWPMGYETIVGPRADAVSGGQQQRICLARALAAQPEVLVLDEPTSALDPRSEALIQDSLNALRGELTLFIIAHRISTLDICDRVMVVVDGRLEAFDTVEFLRQTSSYYRLTSALATGASEMDLR